MRSLSDTLERLARFRAHKTEPPGQPGRLQDLRDFGSNPGRLTGKVHVPSNRAEHPALVVVLHGCTQTASGYDHSAGWSALADQHGFIVLLPEQTRENNGNLCFNWFVPGDIRRDQGEARSIRQMIDAVVVCPQAVQWPTSCCPRIRRCSPPARSSRVCPTVSHQRCRRPSTECEGTASPKLRPCNRN
jgi:poly(3-hydroxybutyrate) depolymerase